MHLISERSVLPERGVRFRPRGIAAFRDQNIDVVVEAARFRLAHTLSGCGVVSGFPASSIATAISPAARWRREIGFRMQIASGRTVNCLSALRVAKRITSGSGRASGAVASALGRASHREPRRVTGSITARAFYHNQFWRHKNYQVIVDAFRFLRRGAPDAVIAASGGRMITADPGYFDGIVRQIDERNLSGNFNISE